MSNEHSEFWLQLLQFGDTEKDRMRNWNIFCAHHLNVLSYPFVAPEHLSVARERFSIGTVDGNLEESLERLTKNHNGPRSLPPNAGPDLQSFMDFSGINFDDDISFSGRMLIGVDFSGAALGKNANFNNAIFIGVTKFEKVTFKSKNQELLDGNQFQGCEFHNTVYFDSSALRFRTRFDRTRFFGAAYFRGTAFKPEVGYPKVPSGFVSFAKCRFESEVNFESADFEYAVDFEGAKFMDNVKFDNANLGGAARFNSAKFNSTTSFRKTSFARPPKFFETLLHEDTDFGEIDWKEAERFYRRKRRKGETPTSLKSDADEAVRSWDRLALIMSQREKLAERHEFFRLKMRAQRKRDGQCLLSLANWLFDATSDYGWSIGRAVCWWLGHMVIGAMALGWAALLCAASAGQGSVQTLWDGVLVSFANAHAILGLASEGGYLYGARRSLYAMSQADSVLNAIGVCQIVLGPVFLFLVLLTLRNRFRIG